MSDMNMPTIAEVLHLAADKYLYSSQLECNGRGASFYSCCAIQSALMGCEWQGTLSISARKKLERRIFKGLKNMGLNPRAITQFNEFGTFSEESQGARYAWLKFAAMIAEEQGV